MLILATGNNLRLAHSGFTLLELLIVMVIIGIVTATVALSSRPPDEHQLQEDAKRVAQLLTVAQDEAQLRTNTLMFEADAQGWRFLQRTETGWRVLNDDLLKPSQWHSPLRTIQLHAATQRSDQTILASGLIRFTIASEPVGQAYVLILQNDTDQVHITSDGMGHYRTNTPFQPSSAITMPAPGKAVA